MRETARRLRERKRRVIFLDGQEIHSIPSFLKEILATLPRDEGPVYRLLEVSRKLGVPPEVAKKFEALIAEKIVGASEPALDAYAELLFKELGAAFAALPKEQRPMLFVDELPFFCDNVMKAAPLTAQAATAARLNNLLAVLRAWRGEDIGVAMAICGSFSMSWLQREHGILSDHVNDCILVQVEELSRAEAVAMVRAMIAHASPRDWQDGVAERLCERLPSLFTGVLQYAFSVIREAPGLTSGALENVYDDKIADGLQKNYYSQFDKRIGHFDADETRAAYALFAALAKQDAPLSWLEAETLCDAGGRLLLDRLVEDGFIRANRKTGVRFASGLARRWYAGGE